MQQQSSEDQYQQNHWTFGDDASSDGVCCKEASDSKSCMPWHISLNQRHKNCLQSAQFKTWRLWFVSPFQCLTKCETWSQPSHLFLNYSVEQWPEKYFCRTLWFHSEVDLWPFWSKKSSLLHCKIFVWNVVKTSAWKLFFFFLGHSDLWPWPLTAKVVSVHQSKWATQIWNNSWECDWWTDGRMDRQTNALQPQLLLAHRYKNTYSMCWSYDLLVKKM